MASVRFEGDPPITVPARGHIHREKVKKLNTIPGPGTYDVTRNKKELWIDGPGSMNRSKLDRT